MNGREVFSSGAGTVFGHFERDTSGTHFSYGISIRKGDAVTTEYHIMNGADEIATITPNKGPYTEASAAGRARPAFVWSSETAIIQWM